MGVRPHGTGYGSFIEHNRGWDENTQTWTYRKTLKPVEKIVIGKYIVNEDGAILCVEETNDEYVFVREYDVKGAGQEMLAIADLVSPHAMFFDSITAAQTYVSENFEDADA